MDSDRLLCEAQEEAEDRESKQEKEPDEMSKRKRIDHGFELIEMKHYDRYGDVVRIQISGIPCGMKPRKDIEIGMGGRSKVIRICILCHRKVKSRVPAHEECMAEYVRQMKKYDGETRGKKK